MPAFVAGESQLGLVASWCKTSKTDVESVMRLRADPFYTRPLGIGMTVADALFAQAVTAEFGVGEAEVAQRVVDAYTRALANPRGMRYPVPTVDSVNESACDAMPMRNAHRAPLTDGAISIVLASKDFVEAHPTCNPLARVAGVGWATDSYRLDQARLRSMKSARTAWDAALDQAGLSDANDLDVIELESQTGYHEAAYVRAFDVRDPAAISPSGGPFAQNPLFCSGLVNAAEAILQVAGRAGAVQRLSVKRAAAHSCHGYAQQGNVVMIFEAAAGVQ